MDLINREEALGCFWNYANNDGTGYDETDMPAYDRLQALPIVAEVEDCISRRAALAYSISGMTREIDGDKWIRVSEVRESIKTMPSAQPEERELHESCTDCPLYDHERHSCPRFNKVIPETLREARQEIIHCKDCVYWDSLPSSSLAPEYHECVKRPFHINTTAEDFCSRAEGRQNGH